MFVSPREVMPIKAAPEDRVSGEELLELSAAAAEAANDSSSASAVIGKSCFDEFDFTFDPSNDALWN